ncbi:hypothetical protein [uncultured Phascolarctobacterium sp.]|uniref:baseplate complex protein n=1 Tax=uncultured Phascolarctobacterium sp. TaxID=512296 RepID=UPI002609553D|nr:hypothetical protein [uncultured Phascolarctobacterium sp.]
MMRIEITDTSGQIKLNDSFIPGVFQKLSIDNEVKYDQKSVSGSSGTKKQAVGFEDAIVSVTYLLQNDEQSTPYQKLQELVALFRSMDKSAKPQIYNIVNEHTAAFGIDRVLFKGIRTNEDNRKDYITATLDFIEWEPPVVKIEERAVRGKVKSRKKLTAADLKKYQKQQFSLDAIADPGESNSEVTMPESPAVDDDAI